MLPRDLIKRLGTFEIDHFDFEGNFQPDTLTLQEQMKVYSFQFKQAVNCFGKQRVALCGKVGCMKDDVVIALQLAVYYGARPEMYA
jgi:hypothetical protein